MSLMSADPAPGGGPLAVRASDEAPVREPSWLWSVRWGSPFLAPRLALEAVRLARPWVRDFLRDVRRGGRAAPLAATFGLAAILAVLAAVGLSGWAAWHALSHAEAVKIDVVIKGVWGPREPLGTPR